MKAKIGRVLLWLAEQPLCWHGLDPAAQGDLRQHSRIQRDGRPHSLVPIAIKTVGLYGINGVGVVGQPRSRERVSGEGARNLNQGDLLCLID